MLDAKTIELTKVRGVWQVSTARQDWDTYVTFGGTYVFGEDHGSGKDWASFIRGKS